MQFLQAGVRRQVFVGGLVWQATRSVIIDARNMHPQAAEEKNRHSMEFSQRVFAFVNSDCPD